MGILLNADGTIDQAFCENEWPSTFDVDYIVGESDEDGPVDWPGADEWRHPQTSASLAGAVVEYGILPAGALSRESAAPPPPGWTEVRVAAGRFARDDLVVGEWFWSDDVDSLWLLDVECEIELDPDGNPVE
jgi:hypothetical protein